MKFCGRCSEAKPEHDFGRNKSRRSGLSVWCKACNASYVREQRKADPKSFQDRERRYRTEQSERVREKNRRAAAKHAARFPARRRAAYLASLKRRRTREPEYFALLALKRRLNRFFSGRKDCRSGKMLGYDRAEFVAHIESLFLPGMTWDNYGHAAMCWHIDHVRPVASFRVEDFSSLPEFVREVFALKNLQPLWCIDNRAKGSLWAGARWKKGIPLAVGG